MGREMASITDHVIDQGGEKIPSRQLGVGAAAWVLQAFEAIANESESIHPNYNYYGKMQNLSKIFWIFPQRH